MGVGVMRATSAGGAWSRDAGRVVVIPGVASGLAAGSARAWYQSSTGVKGAAEPGDEFRGVIGPDHAVGAYEA
jgi:hypothetical protein